ncbi:MAG: 23S rRNA (uracil(1939)-C(5))-methyltransferase RlmD [Hungatella sp.]|jgi:23S rRNA (uracil1939-C5)-methyltransferase|nr:23S rRNA (uracil(1939)-C(5))-methyltransferase RlmD [Hungatella sp.]
MESAGKRNGNKDRQKTEKGNDKKRLTKNRGWQAEDARKKQNPGVRKKSGEEKRGQAPEPERPEVQKSLCPVSKRCGGCQLLDIPYERQLQKKQRQVEELLKGFCKVYPIQGMEEPFHYRNKVHGAFGYQKGKVISGIYKEGSHQLVAVEQCMLEDKKADEIMGTIRGLLKSFKIKTYDEDTGYGFLRHVLVKRGFATGQIMVVLVTTSPVFPSKNHFVKALREKHPEITTIIQNLNDRQTSMVLGDRENVLYGKGYIEDELCGRVFRVSSRSFYQVNPVQTEKLYTKAMELAGLTGRETVIDAYCGIGTIGIIAAEKAGKVIGVELNQDAVRDGVGNARRNHIDNIQFYHNDASRFMTRMARNGEGADVVFMDPPRAGSTEEFVEAVKVLRPKRVVYVSCNPETMARDLGFFSKKGYKAAEAWPFDMFPHTENTEVVCLLKRAARNV